MLDEKALIPCKINQTVKLSIGDPNVEFNSGCSVIEVSIPPSKRCKVRPTLAILFVHAFFRIVL